MCVIMIAYDTPPSEEMLTAGYNNNPHGAGVAWREGKEVHWQKGLSLEALIEKLKATPLPYIVHCRIPSVGADVPEMNHPFPISKSASLELQGKIKGTVLFHNGTWGDWDHELKKAVYMSRTPLPPSHWSDSRAMAWLAGNFGMGYLELLPKHQRIAIMPPAGEEIQTFGEDWKFIDNIWCSNDFWVHRRVLPRGYHTQAPASLTGGAAEGQTSGRMALSRRLDQSLIDAENDLAAVKASNGSAGGRSQVSPFRPLDTKGMSFTEIDRFYRVGLSTGEKLISKKQWKKARKQWEALHGKNWPFETYQYKSKAVSDAAVEKHLRIEDAALRSSRVRAEQELDALMHRPTQEPMGTPPGSPQK